MACYTKILYRAKQLELFDSDQKLRHEVDRLFEIEKLKYSLGKIMVKLKEISEFLISMAL